MQKTRVPAPCVAPLSRKTLAFVPNCSPSRAKRSFLGAGNPGGDFARYFGTQKGVPFARPILGSNGPVCCLRSMRKIIGIFLILGARARVPRKLRPQPPQPYQLTSNSEFGCTKTRVPAPCVPPLSCKTLAFFLNCSPSRTKRSFLGTGLLDMGAQWVHPPWDLSPPNIA